MATREPHPAPMSESPSPSSPARELLEELWLEQSRWSRTANRMKKRIETARRAALTLVVAVAVTATMASALAGAAPEPARVMAAAAAVGAALLPTLRPAWSGTRLRDWTRARSLSEALKSEVYLWLARAGDYRTDPTATRLRTATDRLRADGADLQRYCQGILPEERALPAVQDLRSYFQVRVSSQINDYYRPKAHRLATTLRRFRLAEVALAGAGAALGGVAAIIGPSFASWIAVLATIGTSLTTHVAANRYEFQLIEFLRTAERLSQIVAAAASASPRSVAELAVSAEEVISVENQGWMAKLAEDPPDHVPPDSTAADPLSNDGREAAP